MRSSVDRIFDLLQALVDEPRGLSLADLSRIARLARPTAHRLLSDLIRRGLVHQQSSGNYFVSLTLAGIGLEQLARRGFLDVCQPTLDALADHCGELVRLAWLEGERLVFVAEAQGSGPGLRYDANLGRQAVFHVTAAGKCYLAQMAFPEAVRHVEGQSMLRDPRLGPRALRSVTALKLELTRVKHQGYAIAFDEAEVGAAAVAVPIIGSGGRFLGSLVIVGPSARLDRSKLASWVPNLVDSASGLAQLAPLERHCRKTETNMRRRMA
jgi:IclR family acetate operon transcriptional repressor